MNAVSKSRLVHFKILSAFFFFFLLLFTSDKDQTGSHDTDMHGWCTKQGHLWVKFTSGHKTEKTGVVGRRKKVIAVQRKCEQSSCYCSLFWLSEDLTEPWPLCQQHEEVVRQTHNKMWCSWVLRNRDWGKGSECSLWVCLRFWHGTSGHHCGSCASQSLPGSPSTIRPRVCVPS